MSLKKLGGKNQEIEIITNKYEIYLQKDNRAYVLDYFKSGIKDDDKAHQGSSDYSDFESLKADLKKLGVEDDDIAALKNAWRLF